MGRQPDAPGFLFPALATTDRTRREGLPSSTADGEEARWLRVTRPWAASLSGGCRGREQGWPCGQKPPGARPAPLCGEPGPSGHGLHGTRPGCPTWPCGPGPACTPHPPNARSSLGSSLRSAGAPAHGVKAEPPAPAASSRPPPLPPCLALPAPPLRHCSCSRSAPLQVMLVFWCQGTSHLLQGALLEFPGRDRVALSLAGVLGGLREAWPGSWDI